MMKKETKSNIALFACLIVIALFTFNLIRVSSEYHKEVLKTKTLQTQVDDLAYGLYCELNKNNKNNKEQTND